MAELIFDEVGKRFYKGIGTRQGVLFVQKSDGGYEEGVAWNGLTQVTPAPSGADTQDIYADDMKYFSIQGAERFGGNISAYYSPVEFDQCDGIASPVAGVKLSEQSRKGFAFAYISRIGNDTEGIDYSDVIHIWYGCKASPSQQNHATAAENNTPGALSWTVSCTPVAVTGYKPTSHVELEEKAIGSENYKKVYEMIYGNKTTNSKVPTPDEIIKLIKGGSSAPVPGVGG